MVTRLQRFLADCGVASRRQCEELIVAGRVRINGEVRTQMPVMVDPEHDIITVDDERVAGTRGGGGAREVAVPETLKEQERVYFLLNKPKGILVTNSDPADRKTVGELLTGVRQRVFPVGRLDMDSRGALIMTNDGELANRLTHPRYGVEKTYIVEVDGRVDHAAIEKLKRGIWLGPERPRAAGAHGALKSDAFRVKLIGRERGWTILELKLSEGRNREIRRVLARLGYQVRDLNRVAIAGKITIKGLDVGAFRPLTEAEVKWLYYASSPEYQDKERAATQAWYEKKEMEKERKRLAAAAEAAAQAPRAKTPEPPPENRRPRPERKGRKPFIPPSGRNAGIPLGGNLAGKRRLERETHDHDRPETPTHDQAPSDLPHHPLGHDAISDE
jgi:pseudouridine synthase